MDRGKMSEAKLQSLLLEGGCVLRGASCVSCANRSPNVVLLYVSSRKLIGESDALRDLQELDRELCVWREKVESTIDSRQPDRIAVRVPLTE